MRKERFFRAMDEQCLALVFDDVRLRSGHSKVPPDKVDICSRFSRRVGLKCPIVSSPMDTVTEFDMAIAMAKAGGLGVIHRNLTKDRQAEEVARVKRSLNALIAKPITVSGDETMRQIDERRRREGLNFQSFPVINQDGKLIGVLTKNDFDLSADNPDLKASEVMTRELVVAPQGTTLEKAYKQMRERKKKILPLVGDSGAVVGMYVFSDVVRVRSGNHGGYNVDGKGHLCVAAAIGVGDEAFERALVLVGAGVDVIVIDTAHGDSLPVIEMTKRLKKEGLVSGVDIVAGNVSEGDSARRLADAGADGIRVGQGPGSICTTRIIAGIGCPQVTAIYNCASAVEGSGIPVCADGGITHSGDIPIAIGAGADCVMLGKLLAGTDETPGERLNLGGVPHKAYRGMGSLGAMQDSAASRERYGERGTHKSQLVPEGIEAAVPCRGPVAIELHQQIEGLRRGMGYVGAATIAELKEKADFHRISPAGLRESHPHGVVMTANPPNYKPET